MAFGYSRDRFRVRSPVNSSGNVGLWSNGTNVGIGTTTPNKKLDVEDDIQIGTGTTGCVLDADNTTLVGTCVSDIRLKKDIKPLQPVLDRVAALQPVTFKWKQDGNATEYGLIAQDVQKTMPELVQEGSDGYLRVSYDTKLYMVMLQSIKELKAENEELKAENEMLKEKDRAMGYDIEILKQDVQKLKISVNGGK